MKIGKKTKEMALDALVNELKEMNEIFKKIEQNYKITTWEKESKASEIRKLKDKNKQLRKQLQEEKCKKN